MKGIMVVLIMMLSAGLAMASDCVVEKSTNPVEYSDCDRRLVLICHDVENIEEGDKVTVREKLITITTGEKQKPVTIPCALGIGD